MKVKELIKELKKFDGELEVQYDFQEQFTLIVDEVKEVNEDYELDKKKIVVLY